MMTGQKLRTMILSFSTKINGKPSYFIEKIWEGLLRNVFENDIDYIDYMSRHEEVFGKNWDFIPDETERMTSGKIHTIREDKKDRWQTGTKIDFFINTYQKNMFRFAPVLPVVSVQKIEIKWFDDGKIKQVSVFIDGKIYGTVCYNFGVNVTELYKRKKLDLLAQNDGFDTIEDFFAYFNEDFKGKLIHWTDLKY